MRWLIDEQISWRYNDMKAYVLDINEFTDEALIDEIVKNTQELRHYSKYVFDYEWLCGYRDRFVDKNHIDLIACAVEEKWYIMDDEEEHEYNMQVVRAIIENMPVRDRYTGEKYE